jgi:hypothetical protein
MRSAAGGRVRPVLIVVTAVVGILLATASIATAGKVHPFLGSFGAFSSPQAVAVDQSSGDVYVIDVGAAAVQKFDASGTPADFSALGSNTLDGAGGADATPEGGFAFDGPSAAEVAVDDSGGATDDYLYVTNSLAGVVDVFDATGSFVGEIDGSAATPQTGGEACGVATDPTGHVYVGYFSGHVDKYTPTDANPAHDTFDGQLENLSGICSVAADGLGSIYASTWSVGPLTKYDQAQLDQDTPSGTVVDDTSLGVAVDPTTNDVYVDHGDRVVEYDASCTGAGPCTPIGQSGAGHLTGSSFGVAIRGSSGLLYASNNDDGTVQRYGPAVDIDPPTVTIDPPSDITSSHATFSGTVNPQGNDPLNGTSWHFEYSTDGGNGFTSTPGGNAGTGAGPVQVSEDVNAFIPNQPVQVRLVASNAAGSITSSVESFTTTTIAPDVTTQPAQDVAPTHASLSGLINAHNLPTTYFFEYGPTTAYGTSVPAAHDGDAGSFEAVVGAVQRIGDLQPGTTYHYRLVATNQAGTTPGADQAFTTTMPPPASSARAGIPGTGFLPDQRGWEKVSPDRKNGGDVLADSSRTRVARDGNSVQFSSLAAFGDAIGTSLATDYMGLRGANGWSTHAITPRQAPLTVKPILATVQSLYVGELSDDLSKGVFLGWSPVTSDPNVANVANVYLRDDLKKPGAGAYQLLSSCPLCEGTSSPLPAPLGNSNGAGEPFVAGTSADFGHVLFESQEPRTSDAPAGCDNNLFDTNQCPGNLYEWDHGTVRLVGILPDDSVAHGSQAGQGAGSFQGQFLSTPHTISADGSRIFFTVPESPGSQNGQLYARIDHITTVQLNEPELSPGHPDPNPGQSATYWDASADGSRVFFTSSEPLTDDAPANGGRKLYMYDTTRPASDSNLTLISATNVPSATPDVQTVLGASADGHYVYFMTSGQLVAGQPGVGVSAVIYVWHDGTVRFVAPVNQSDFGDDSNTIEWTLTRHVAKVTPDGKHVLFSSAFPQPGPTGFDQTCAQGGNCRQLYLYSDDTQHVACVSCNPSGAPATGSALVGIRTNNGTALTTSAGSNPLSDDGSKVFFTSPDALVPQDTNGKLDAYEYDVPTGTLHLLSNGREPSDSYFMTASPSGDDAFIVTRAQLVGSDTDNSYDLYDARVDGGFPDLPPSPPACAGDGCRSPQSTPPATVTPGTGPVTRNGNLPSKRVAKPKPKPKPRPCRKGFARKKVHGKTKCVKVKKPRHTAPKARAKHAKRATAAHRRTK